ncbi:hypothetical protein AWD73_003323 [Escherichia coli]|nr:hypothetical protein [Escherichia coli]
MMTTRIVVGLTAGTCLIFSQNLMAEVSVFNPALLEIDHQSGVDIRQFNRANLMPQVFIALIFLSTVKCLNVRM